VKRVAVAMRARSRVARPCERAAVAVPECGLAPASRERALSVPLGRHVPPEQRE